VKDGMVAYHEANQPVAPTPIDGQPLDREGNIDQFNKYLSNQGEGNAQIVTQKDGTKTLSYTDQVSGETRHLNLSEMTPEQLKVVKDGMVAYHEANQPVAPAPIDGEKPVPSEGQKIVEGLKKAADGIRDAEKDWGENSTGAIVEYSQSVQAQTQSQIDELYALGNQNATDINTLFNEVDRLDSKIDGVAAMSQASLAARPYLSTNQTSSVGVGIGGAGSEAAFALGYAHRMTENWTANANVAVNTGDSAEASYGAGVSYAW
ncbi:YadA C-terminal domain-containing protein, partial [Vibrio lentus]|uniref:YadA C-terminal domain-containing protein n=1 Tax=Vibrio lentus TaxID=136468 RepID=UPI001A7E07F0